MASDYASRLGGARSSLAFKSPCRVATTVNIALTGEQTVDGVAVAETTPPTRVLVKNQTLAYENGIYEVRATAWVRAKDFDGADDVVKGTRVYVHSGVTQSGCYVVTSADPITIGSSVITFTVSLLVDNPDIVSRVFDVMSPPYNAPVGGADATDSIQAAIDAAEVAGGVVYVPSHFRTTAPLTLQASNVWIVGNGNSSSITLDNASTGQDVLRIGFTGSQISGITVKDMVLARTQIDATCALISLQDVGASNIFTNRLYGNNKSGYGIKGIRCIEIRVFDNFIDYSTKDQISFAGTGIGANRCISIEVNRNIIYGGYSGVHYGNYVEGTYTDNNIIFNQTSACVLFDPSAANAFGSHKFRDNDFDTAPHGFYGQNLRNFTFDGNWHSNLSAGGVTILSGTSGTISGSQFYLTGQNCIVLGDNVNAINTVACGGNVMSGAGAARGYLIRGLATDISIDGDVIRGMATAAIDGNSEASTNVSINDCVFASNFANIAGAPASGWAISPLPATTDNTVPRFNGTAGALQTSGVIISDTNGLSVPGGEVTGSGSAGQMAVSATGATATSALLIARGASAGSNPGGFEMYAGNAEAMRIDRNQEIYVPNVGTTASAANAFLDSGATPANQLLRSTSSAAYKKDVEDLLPDYADAVLSMRPVWYRSKASADRKDWGWYGLIAEEVAAIDPRLVQWGYHQDQLEEITIVDESGKDLRVRRPRAEEQKRPDGVMYERLSVMLISVVQRLERRVAELESLIPAD